MREYRPWASTAIVASIAFAATIGALIEIGRRMGSMDAPFAWVGAGFPDRATAPASTVVVTGLILQAGATVVWSAIFGRLVCALRWSPPLGAATIVVLSLFESWLWAVSTGAGVSTLIALGDRIVLAVVLGGALAAGSRFADAELLTP